MEYNFIFNEKENLSETDYDKIKKKQNLVRNNFETVGKYNIPIVKKQKLNIEDLEPWCYSKTKIGDKENERKIIHFFTYDWLYENVYNKPEKTMEKLEQYYALMTPDFSLYSDMPLSLQIYNTFKNRWCGAFWQSQGKLVIPTISWSKEESFEFCFDGVEKGSIVAVSTYRQEKYEKEFMNGYNKMLEIIQPLKVLCYGEPFKDMGDNVIFLDPFNKKELIKKIGVEEFTRKYLAGELYPTN